MSAVRKLLLITDAWSPQTNGVVTTYQHVVQVLIARGIEVNVIHPGLFFSVPCPAYTEIRLSLNLWRLPEMIRNAAADAIHIAVEGPLGLAARAYLNYRHQSYTTSFHTKFPEYVHARLPFIPVKIGYRFMRWFHRNSQTVLVTTPSLRNDLQQWGLNNLIVWTRGVDTQQFDYQAGQKPDQKTPVFIYAGRVAVEKNIEAFLKLDLPGRKVVVGDGPSRQRLQKQYPDVEFAGFQYGDDLARYYAQANVFVFPSRTDTFGVVMLEAMAAGNPVAAYPVAGPIDVIKPGYSGCLDEDLQQAALTALMLSPADARQYAKQFSWQATADLFYQNLHPVKKPA